MAPTAPGTPAAHQYDLTRERAGQPRPSALRRRRPYRGGAGRAHPRWQSRRSSPMRTTTADG